MDKLLPCRKCGKLDYDFWDGKGTQAYLTCNECGQEEGVQVTDLYDSVNEWPRFCQRTVSYPAYAVEKANQALIKEWNTRTDTSKDKLIAALTDIRTYVLAAESDSNFSATREKLITRIKYLTQKGLAAALKEAE